MSFINLSRELFETTTINIKPQVHFVSSSVGQIPATGSMYVAPVRSKCIRDLVKDLDDVNLNVEAGSFDILDYAAINSLDFVNNYVRENYTSYATGMDISGYLEIYLQASGDSPKNIRFSKFLDIFRFDTPLRFNLNHVVKRNLNNILYPYYRNRYPSSGVHYTNYNCLNFFTASHVPSDSCLVYPNKSDAYTPEKGFTLDFWINPRYDNFVQNTEFSAGTIFHMSSSIAVSLVSGSLTDERNLVSDYKMLLQLSHSADINPSNINLSDLNASSDLIFTSSFNLKKNHWHHVSVAWDPDVNNSSGSIRIDDTVESFNIPSSSLFTRQNKIVCIGNYYDGIPDDAEKLFNSKVANAQGLTQLTSLTVEPNKQKTIFRNPLNAEVHDVKLFKRGLNNFEIDKLSTGGVNQITVTKEGCVASESSLYDDLLFFVPPFFYPETRTRDVIVTPFQTIRQSTNDPINVSYSFGLGGKLVNLENFTREFIQGEYPRLQSLTGSTINTTVQNITADDYVYNSGSLVKRNFTLLPCDNGKFYPDYYPISISPQSASLSYVKAGSLFDYARVNLDDLIPSSSLFPGLVFQEGTIFDQIVGASPENPGVAPGAVLTVAQRTRDLSSNETTIFDISNLYYGNRITEETFLMVDEDLTGSKGRIKVKIRDNGKGNLYRADCLTQQATWNNVGDLFYHEGMAIIKTPHLPYYCKDKTDITFKGDQNVHTLILNIPCEKGQFNSSSNKTYTPSPPTNAVSDRDLSTVYISSVNIHDDNFNIIMKANFSQPIPKTEEDEFVIRLKQDF